MLLNFKYFLLSLYSKFCLIYCFVTKLKGLIQDKKFGLRSIQFLLFYVEDFLVLAKF